MPEISLLSSYYHLNYTLVVAVIFIATTLPFSCIMHFFWKEIFLESSSFLILWEDSSNIIICLYSAISFTLLCIYSKIHTHTRAHTRHKLGSSFQIHILSESGYFYSESMSLFWIQLVASVKVITSLKLLRYQTWTFHVPSHIHYVLICLLLSCWVAVLGLSPWDSVKPTDGAQLASGRCCLSSRRVNILARCEHSVATWETW